MDLITDSQTLELLAQIITRNVLRGIDCHDNAASAAYVIVLSPISVDSYG